MRALVVIATAVPLVAVLSAGSCQPPPRPLGVGEGEGDTASQCDADGVALPKPLGEDGAPIEASLPAGGAIDVSCIGNPPLLAASTVVRIQGCIDVFGLGDRAKRGITVAVFADAQNPGTDVPEFGQVEIAVQEDAINFDDCAGADANEPACLSLTCERRGAYALDNIPTHVPLTMKVSKSGDDTVIDTYSFGVVFDYQDNAAVDGVVTYAANLIYSSTWSTIPTLAGRLIDGGSTLGDGEGRAVVAGEIHDCNDKIVEGASVTTDLIDAATKITYFDGNASDPKPKLTRLSTNNDGLYVVLNANTAAGADVHTISAGILEPGCNGDDCACSSLGSRTIRAFPDSVSIVTLRGDLPTVP